MNYDSLNTTATKEFKAEARRIRKIHEDQVKMDAQTVVNELFILVDTLLGSFNAGNGKVTYDAKRFDTYWKGEDQQNGTQSSSLVVREHHRLADNSRIVTQPCCLKLVLNQNNLTVFNTDYVKGRCQAVGKPLFECMDVQKLRWADAPVEPMIGALVESLQNRGPRFENASNS
ncbi:MAG: hypothetical protein AB7E52_05550 [Bdellovibrionales bacterium]